jgi:RecB family exonuclease
MIEETVDKTGKIPTKNAAVKKLKEKWIFKSYSRASEEKTFRERAEKMTENYLRWRKSNKNKFIESEAYIEYKFAGITLNGKIDWIEQDKNGDYEIVDFKTSKKAISQNKADVDWQLHIYAKLIEKEYGKLPTKATLYFLNEDKKVTVKIEKNKVKNILEKELKPIIEKILREEFEAKPEHNKCTFNCDYSDICSFKK